MSYPQHTSRTVPIDATSGSGVPDASGALNPAGVPDPAGEPSGAEMPTGPARAADTRLARAGSAGTGAPRVQVCGATIGYDKRVISTDLSVHVPHESFTAVIGPNGCGKSTLLRAIARVLTPNAGQVILDGRSIREYRSKEVARRLGLLPQTSLAPDGIRVADLVARGRAPHQSLIQQWRTEDEVAVRAALAATHLSELSGRLVDELSGGQRQRVWVAMLLAQHTPIMLLDEPTTFLDIAHQYELMELFRTLHASGKTIVTVLHDLNQAARYADHLIVMKDGALVTTGTPAEVITPDLIEDVFGLRALVVPDPVTGTPAVVPLDPRRHPPPHLDRAHRPHEPAPLKE